MKTVSYSHSLHNLTTFSLINQGDDFTTCVWKAPTGRILSAAVTLTALAESTLATLLTVLSSPLYFIHRDSFNAIIGEAADSAKTVGLAANRFFGFEKIEQETTSRRLPMRKRPSPMNPVDMALHSLKERVSAVTHFAHKWRKPTFIAVTFGATILGAYHLGLFEHVFSLRPFQTHSLEPLINLNASTCPAITNPILGIANAKKTLIVANKSLGTCPAIPKPVLAIADKPFNQDEFSRLIEPISTVYEKSLNSTLCFPIDEIILNGKIAKVSSEVPTLWGNLLRKSAAIFQRVPYYASRMKTVTQPLTSWYFRLCVPVFILDSIFGFKIS